MPCRRFRRRHHSFIIGGGRRGVAARRFGRPFRRSSGDVRRGATALRLVVWMRRRRADAGRARGVDERGDGALCAYVAIGIAAGASTWLMPPRARQILPTSPSYRRRKYLYNRSS